jgi:hypothetical protein
VTPAQLFNSENFQVNVFIKERRGEVKKKTENSQKSDWPEFYCQTLKINCMHCLCGLVVFVMAAIWLW